MMQAWRFFLVKTQKTSKLKMLETNILVHTFPSPPFAFDPKKAPRLDCFIVVEKLLFKSWCSKSKTYACFKVP